ncbi:MAG: hypothetical protein FWE04_03180 [Oscillospiraceae bacterium]|nr:hypothetical protein [Oscillospiraceae bacterium]
MSIKDDQLGMKWFYFRYFIFGLGFLTHGIFLLRIFSIFGAGYNLPFTLAFSVINAVAFVIAAIGFFMKKTWFLKAFVFMAVSNILNSLVSFITDGEIAFTIASLLTSIIFVLEYIYFNKRKFMFKR